jgi:hypothetical protein
MADELRQSIYMQPRYRLGEPIMLRFEITNTGNETCALLIWDTPLSREVMNFLEVRHDGRRLPYDGRFVKRGEPTAESYRTLAPGETIAEELDLSTSFAFEQPGIYTVTLNVRFIDVIRGAGAGYRARQRDEHETLALERLSATFELVPDGTPRLTSGQQTRVRLATRSRLGPDDLSRQAATSRLTIGPDERRQLRNMDLNAGGFGDNVPAWFADSFAADENALAWVTAAVYELSSWSAHTDNALYTEWFGADDAARYNAVREHFVAIRARLQMPHTYDGSGDDCDPNTYAYTWADSDTVWLCSLWFTAPATGRDSKFGTYVHEWSHAVAETEDFASGHNGAHNLADTRPFDAIRNADNHEYMVETLADRMLTAPVVWPNGKAYFFTAGQYYRYDIATDHVDPGYPKPIAGNWPGLWTDRIDAGVVWPNGKAYFFRDHAYMRYDIATDRVDAGYPLPIAANWPGLGAERIDSCIVWPNGKAYFFRGTQYWRYDIATDRVDPGYPRPIAGNWPGLWGDGIQGAVVWNNGKAYFFRGWQYMRYDIAADRVDANYPRAIAESWPILWGDGLDAAVFWPNGKGYFFRGSEYMRYDNATDRVDPGYPRPIAGNWPGLWTDRIDAAIVWPDGKAYFFRDTEYMRYDIAADGVDPGYPQPIHPNWPGLGPAKIDSAVVWPNGKAYFFRGGHYWRFDIATNRVDHQGPLTIGDGWHGLGSDPIDAIVVWNNGKAYVFRKQWYWRYDIASDRTDENYPSLTGWNWPWLPGRVR